MIGYVKRAVGAALANFAGWMGAYNSTDPRRKILELWKVQRASANQALGYNLPTLVNQCRQLERNCPSARAVVEGFVADVIGTGIDVAPDTGSSSRDDKIRKVWLEWCEHAGVAGESLWELQAQAAREINSAGGTLWRYLVLPERIAEGRLPLAVMPLGIEWLSVLAVAPIANGSVFLNGLEMDTLGRVVAYHIINPDLLNGATPGPGAIGERVPAKYISYGFERRRPGQSLGEPNFASVIERFKQEEDLVRIELQSAQIASNLAVAIKSEYHEDSTSGGDGTGDAVVDLSPGTVTRLFPGEEAQVIQSSRPNQLIAPFRAMLRGDIAAACRVSRKWLDRDYSSSTFMNTRMEQNDATRMHKATQDWLGRAVASRPYCEVLPWILLRLGMEMPAEPLARNKILAHRILPDLPGYVDPLKDGEAAAQNIASNLSTLEEECSKRGRDYKKIAAQRAEEKKFLASLDLSDVTELAQWAVPSDQASPSKAAADAGQTADAAPAAKKDSKDG